jgi:hypothetical protein
MKERVRLVNGSFAIESGPGVGTRIRVQVSLDAQARNTDPEGAPCEVYEMASSVPEKRAFYENDIGAAC